MQSKTIPWLILLFFHLSLSVNSQQALSDDTRAELALLAESFLQQTKAPGLSIALRSNGNMLYAKGFGYADLEENIKMNTSIRLRTASVAKVITATALGVLASEGKLDFDAPIKKYVPYIQKAYADLTTRQLAGHTAGLAHRPKGEKYKKKQYDNIRETVLLMNAPLLFEADTDYTYSTHAYNLLGAVIEGASGRTYLEYMNEAVFTPLGMKHTFAEHIKSLTKKEAQLYTIKNGSLRKDKITNASYKIPGAGFRSTPSDLVKMMDAYTNGMISKTVMGEMFKSNTLKNGKKTNVGIAWRSSIDPFEDIVIEHAGSWRGARTVVVHYPKENLNISLMINASCPVLIEETAHMFAQVVRRGTKAASNINLTNENITLTLKTKEGKETYEGHFTFNTKEGLLKTNSKGFLNTNPILYLGSTNNYALSSSYGLLYLHLKNDKALEGSLFSYFNRLDKNPKNEVPLATFKK